MGIGIGDYDWVFVLRIGDWKLGSGLGIKFGDWRLELDIGVGDWGLRLGVGDLN